MDERVLTPSTSVLTVLVVGMVAGHVLMPARGDATTVSRAGFVIALVAAGALGGWRTGRAFDVRRAGLTSLAGAALAVALAAAAYAIVHG